MKLYQWTQVVTFARSFQFLCLQVLKISCRLLISSYKPRCEIRVAKDCQNRPNLKVFFKASKWLDMLRTSMTTIASTFVLQKKSFFSFFPLIFKQTVKKEEFRLTNNKTSITRGVITKNYHFKLPWATPHPLPPPFLLAKKSITS